MSILSSIFCLFLILFMWLMSIAYVILIMYGIYWVLTNIGKTTFDKLKVTQRIK